MINDDKVAAILAIQGNWKAAAQRLSAAVTSDDGLVAAEPRNTRLRDEGIQLREDLAETLLAERQIAAAQPLVSEARDQAEMLVRKDPTVEYWNGILLGRARVLDMEIAQASASDAVTRRDALAPALREAARLDSLINQPFPDVRLLRIDAQAHILAGDYALELGDTNAAKANWLSAERALVLAGDDDPARAGQPGYAMLAQANGRLLKSTAQLTTGSQSRFR